ncbi:MAG: TauD/TfdA family dioxygenase [Ostreibacterium sp.]
MTISVKAMTLDSHYLTITWANEHQSIYHYLWLRDNCASGFHEITQERLFSLLSVSPDLHALSAKISDDQQSLIIDWSEGNHCSSFDLNWLKAHDYSRQVHQNSHKIIWNHHYQTHIATHDYRQIINNDSALKAWMTDLTKYGLTIINHMPKDTASTTDIACRIGHLRETNFGTTFNVKSKPNPNNLAYTADALPLHTDLPNQETPPGYQFLHCLENQSQGGDSTYVDGFQVAKYLRDNHANDFALLSTIKIPFRFHDNQHDIIGYHPVISLIDGRIDEIKYNAHLASTFNLSPEIMYDYYLAYQHFMATLNKPEFMISFKMNAGDMVVFDNRRVLHGRMSFDPNTGPRHLHGCYIDRTEFESKHRMLKKQFMKT